MNALGVVVADTTPLNYLILIDRFDILAGLFGEVLIPPFSAWICIAIALAKAAGYRETQLFEKRRRRSEALA